MVSLYDRCMSRMQLGIGKTPLLTLLTWDLVWYSPHRKVLCLAVSAKGVGINNGFTKGIWHYPKKLPSIVPRCYTIWLNQLKLGWFLSKESRGQLWIWYMVMEEILHHLRWTQWDKQINNQSQWVQLFLVELSAWTLTLAPNSWQIPSNLLGPPVFPYTNTTCLWDQHINQTSVLK